MRARRTKRRQPKLHVTVRGTRLWVRWSDGTGGRISKALRDRDGSPLFDGAAKRLVESAARRAYAQHNGTLVKEGLGKLTSSRKPLPPTYGDLEESYFNARRATWSPRSVCLYTYWAEDMRRFLTPLAPLESIGMERAEAFKASLLGRGFSSNTIIHRLEFASGMWTWGMKTELVTRNPWKLIDRPRRILQRPADPFTPDEVSRILATARDRFAWVYPAILTAALTGCRRGTLRLLDVRDWDARGRRLVLRPEISKQSQGHVYTAPEVLAEVLDGITAKRLPTAPLFTNRWGRRLSAKALDAHSGSSQLPNVWRRILDAANVRPRGIHQLRSAVDSNLVMAGTPLDLALAVTGHTREVARAHYLRVNSASQRETMAKLASVYGLGKDVQEVPAKIGEFRLASNEALLLLQAITCYEGLLYRCCGTESLYTRDDDGVEDTDKSRREEREERSESLPQDGAFKAPPKPSSTGESTKQALESLLALKTRILEHAREDALTRRAEKHHKSGTSTG